MDRHAELANFIWAIADLLRHNYKQHEYGQVILPLTVLRRLDCVLEPTREKVRAEHERYTGKIPMLTRSCGTPQGRPSTTPPSTIASCPRADRRHTEAHRR